ncbi:hypothetical protein Tco_1029875 [Tanacetum coccineum]|uniref:Uncharacterized protein n=1 Tax=Tanacetum coccineum TaxID=301880 RepID=A0ABQ5G589_9ASTR
MESPINVMSRIHYNWIMRKRLEPRRKPSNPKKICNFVGRVKGLKVFVGNFTYKCDFVVLGDTTSVIDHDLCEDDYDRGYRKPSDLEDGFYRDTIKLRPEYVTRFADEGEVT